MTEKRELSRNDTNPPAGNTTALQSRQVPYLKPRYTSRYNENSWEVAVQLPGVTRDHLDVTVENEILEIKATRLLDTPDDWRPLADYPEEKNYRLRLDVGPEVDGSGISASLEDGVLTLTLPLREEVKPRSIEVK